MELALFLSGIFFFTFLIGALLEKIRVPWVFAALILGVAFSFKNPFKTLVSSEAFDFLAWLGMYFLLFLIGFELELKRIKSLGKFIIKSTFLIIVFEAFFGSLLVHFVFGYPWFLSSLVALSFATVGEAVLIPILDEFGLTKTDLGQTILGIGSLDDTIEVFVIALASLAIPILTKEEGGKVIGLEDVLVIFLSLVTLFLFAFGAVEFKKKLFILKTKGIEATFLLVLGILFLFIGLGSFASAAALGALLAGISVKNFLPRGKVEKIEQEVKSLSYGFFGPIFFFWVGVDTNLEHLFSSLSLVALVVAVTYLAKIFASFLVAQKKMGAKPSIFMGIALGVRFSTSIVIIKFLFEKALIGEKLYSVLIASSIAFKFIIPFWLSFLARRWRIVPELT